MKKCEICGYKEYYFKMFDYFFERINETTVKDKRTGEIINLENIK